MTAFSEAVLALKLPGSFTQDHLKDPDVVSKLMQHTELSKLAVFPSIVERVKTARTLQQDGKKLHYC